MKKEEENTNIDVEGDNKKKNLEQNENIIKKVLEEQEIEEKKEVSVEQKLEEIEEKFARSLAEMENQRRRFEKEKNDAFDFGGFTFAKEILSIIDNLDHAKLSILNDGILKKNNDLNKFLENFNIIQKDIISIFKKNGIEQIDCLNKKFDPNFHQAMIEVENDDKEPGIVLNEIQKGFKMKDRLLRPSLVGVSKRKRKENDEKNQKSEENQEKK